VSGVARPIPVILGGECIAISRLAVKMIPVGPRGGEDRF
jgi:hypothetical protein